MLSLTSRLMTCSRFCQGTSSHTLSRGMLIRTKQGQTLGYVAAIQESTGKPCHLLMATFKPPLQYYLIPLENIYSVCSESIFLRLETRELSQFAVHTFQT